MRLVILSILHMAQAFVLPFATKGKNRRTDVLIKVWQ